MSEEKKKKKARIIQDLYLYPTRDIMDSLLRIFAWTISWLIGIVLQSVPGQQMRGGAFFVFALSLLIEFVPERGVTLWGRIAHTIFCVLLGFILLGALPLVFPRNITEDIQAESLLSELVYFIGWIVVGMMWVREVLSMLELHKLFYDEEAETKIKEEVEEKNKEKESKELIQAFLNRLNGTPYGEENE